MELERLREEIQRTSELYLESKSNGQSFDQSQLDLISYKIDEQEQLLTQAEHHTHNQAQLRQWEQDLLSVSQQFTKLEKLVRGESKPKFQPAQHLDNGQLVQLQERMMSNQDQQLDELSKIIQRQKELGEMISDELEIQVELLEDTDERVENQSHSLGFAQRNLERFFVAAQSDSRATSVMCFLIVILILLLVLSKLLL